MICTLGIDVGTTGLRALLVDGQGRVVASASESYPLQTLAPGWAEQDPEDWWAACCRAVPALLERWGRPASEVVAVGLTGQMHSAVLLDGAGAVVRPAILWNDQRTAAECREIEERVGLDRLLRIAANRALPGFTAPKLLWVRRHEPDPFGRVRTVLLPKDHLRYRLTGARATEVSDAAGTLLLDVRARRWSEELARALDLDPAILPEVVESPVVTGHVTAEAAAVTGLRAGTPVVGGAGDNAAAAVGLGVVRPGLASLSVGTSGVIFAHLDDYPANPDGRVHLFCHAVPGRWHSMAVTLSAGGSLRWFRGALGGEEVAAAYQQGQGIDPYELLADEAAGIPPGSDGLIFLPYLMGERTPYADPDIRGGFFGLDAGHRKGHLVRAVLEGVAFSLRDCLALMAEAGGRIEELRGTGGGVRSPLWRQILADVLDAELALTAVDEGAAYGAALLAAVGAGLFPSVEAAGDAVVLVVGRVSPQPANREAYDAAYGLYRKLYPALRAVGSRQ